MYIYMSINIYICIYIYVYIYICIYICIYRVGYMAKWLSSSTQNHRPNPHLDHLTLGRKACPICLRGPQRHPRRLYLGEVKSNQHPQNDPCCFLWFIYHAYMDCLRLVFCGHTAALRNFVSTWTQIAPNLQTNSWKCFQVLGKICVSAFPCTMGIAAQLP